MSALPTATSPIAASASAASEPPARFEFRPLNVGRFVIWGLFVLVLAVAPLVFTSSLSITMLSQMGIAIVACLSFNMLLGQGGMLSFGHAVYTGLAAFVSVHMLNKISGGLPLAVRFITIAGGGR